MNYRLKRFVRNTIFLLTFVVAALLLAQSSVETKAADTGIVGDADANGTVDVKDLVRGLKHKSDTSIEISGDIDLNKNTVLSDDKDCKYLKVILLGGEYKVTALADAVKVGKYDNEARTFDVSLPETVALDANATLDSAVARERNIGINQYADGKMTLSTTNLADREYITTFSTAFVTGMEKVEIVTMPVDVYAMVINDETELNYFPTAAQICPSGYYILGNDIFCTGTYTSNYNWEFTGTFNGMLHTIYNMNVVSGDTHSGGLFGFRFGKNGKNSAFMKYISFVNATYTGKGGFIASIMGGTLQDVYIDIKMNSVDGTYIEGSTVLGGYTYGGLLYKGVIVNYREPLAAGVTTGIPVYEMHHGYDTYQGLYVIGADKVNGENEAIEATDYCGAYPTETDFHDAVAAGTVNFDGFDTGYWKIQDGAIPMPHTLAYYVDPTLEDGVLADFTEVGYKNNVTTGRAVETFAKAEVLNSYTDATGDTANGVLKVTPTEYVNDKFDFSLRFGQKIDCNQIESIRVRITQTNVSSEGSALKTIFVSDNRRKFQWGQPFADYPYEFFEVPENDWTTITISNEELLAAAADDGYIYSLSFFCDNGRVDTSKPAAIYIDEITYTLKELYANGKEMYLGAFSSPLPNQASYDECAAAGFNYVLLDEDFGNTRGSEVQAQTLEYCNNSNLTALVMAMNLHNTYDETVDETDYTKFEAYGGSFFYDEPYPNSFDYIAEAIPEFEQKYSGKTFMVNLHPCTPFLNKAEECKYNGKQYTYEEYLEEFKTKVLDKLSGPKILSADIYPLLDGNEGEYQILPQYLYNLEATAKLARGTDLMTHYYILTHGNSIYRAITSVADINFQYYTAMAYGVQGFSCFTYKQQKGTEFAGRDGLVNWEVAEDGSVTSKTTAIYDYVKTANYNLRSFENVYLAFDWQKTMAISGSASEKENECYGMLTENATKIDGIDSVSATQDTLVGYFVDENSTKGYMITNFSEPSKGLIDEVELKLDKASTVRVHQNGKVKVLPSQNGSVRLSLSPGEGAFIVVF